MSRGRHHKPSALRRGLVVAGAGASALALASSLTSAAAATADPTPTTDCVSLVQALVQAQIGTNDSSASLKRAQKADADARATRDQAKIDAQSQYNSVDRPAAAAVKDDPATDADEHAAALQSALDKRDAKLAAADKAYDDGGTAAALTKAQARERKTSGVLASVKLQVGQLCNSTPAAPSAPAPAPSSEQPTTVTQAPAPQIVTSNLPVTH